VRELPSGTVTFLFMDIERSTRLLHEHGARRAGLLGEHRRVLRAAFAQHGRVEVDTQGDAFFVAFARASDAIGRPPSRHVPDLRHPRARSPAVHATHPVFFRGWLRPESRGVTRTDVAAKRSIALRQR
jgi:class 3 adenylate cyclase